LRQFAIEAEIRGQPPTAWLAARQQRSLAELDALKAFLERELVRVSGKSTLAQTIRYALWRWDAHPASPCNRHRPRFATSGRILLQEPDLQIRATFLDHGEAVLAFALEERAHINVRRNKVEAMGLAIGPWLRAFKESTIRGAPDDTLIEVAGEIGPPIRPHPFPLAFSKRRS